MIELNLVKNQGIYSPVYTLLSRTRIGIDVKDTAACVEAAMSFLKNNHDTLLMAISDSDFVERIMAADKITLDEFMSMKYIMAQNGIDILVNEVAEMEINPEDIEDGTNEYNLINNLSDSTFKTATKVVVSSDFESMSSVYDKLCGLYNFFNGNITKGYKNPIDVQLNQLKKMETAMGKSSTSITTYLNSIMEYLGKSIIMISNE